MMHAALLILVSAAVTLLIRAIPFLIFPEGKKPPQIVTTLSLLLPSAVIGMLVVYCLKGISFITAPHGLPELLAVASVVALHVWKRNTLLSILLGTIIYMMLVQVVFH